MFEWGSALSASSSQDLTNPNVAVMHEDFCTPLETSCCHGSTWQSGR